MVPQDGFGGAILRVGNPFVDGNPVADQGRKARAKTERHALFVNGQEDPMLQSWRDQFLENLEWCRPDLLESMQKKGTLEQYLDARENRAIEMSKQFKKDGLAEDQVVELVTDDLFLREIDEPEEGEEEWSPPAPVETAPPSTEDDLLAWLKSLPVGTKFRFKLPDLDNSDLS
jgi:hypothetical protein